MWKGRLCITQTCTHTYTHTHTYVWVPVRGSSAFSLNSTVNLPWKLLPTGCFIFHPVLSLQPVCVTTCTDCGLKISVWCESRSCQKFVDYNYSITQLINQLSKLCMADYDARGYFLNQAFEWKTSASRCPHWMEYSCINSPFIIPPTICVPIGCRPRYSTMRHNELAGNQGVATTSISLNIRWRMSHWITWMGDMCEEERNGRQQLAFCFLFVCACVRVNLPEVAHHSKSLEVLVIAPMKINVKYIQVTGTYRHILMDTPLVCCSVHLTCKLLWAEIAFSLYETLQNL